MDSCLKASAHITESDDPFLVITANTDSTSGELDILGKFIRTLQSPDFRPLVRTVVTEDLAVAPSELPEKYWEVPFSDIPPIFRKKTVQIVIKLAPVDSDVQSSERLPPQK